MSTPKIDKRDYKYLLKQIHELIPFYTPEWKAVEESDPGVALLKIFVGMFAGTVNRLNQVPDKNFIAFLNMLGLKLLPAESSHAPVTFHLSEGVTETIFISAGTQVASSPSEDGDPIVFETEKNMLATPAKLITAISTNQNEDCIFQAPRGFLEGEQLIPFLGKTTMRAKSGTTSIFLDKTKGLERGDILKINGEYAEISRVFDSKILFTDKLKYSHKTGSVVKRVTLFEVFTGYNKQEHILYLGHQNLFNIKGQACVELEFKGSEHICLWNDSLVNWQYWGERTEIINGREVKTLDWYNFPSVCSDEKRNKLFLYKNNNENDEIKECEVNNIKSYWIRCIVQQQKINEVKNITVGAIKTVVRPLKKHMVFDLIFHNDIPMDIKEFLPFGRRPRLFDTFYIASQEAFSKKGLTITIEFSLSFDCDNQTVSSEPILNEKNPELSWEYWNGKGWLKLTGVCENFTDTAKSSIEFTCPVDIAQTMINGHLNYWIRSRIISGNYGQEEMIEEEIGSNKFVLKPNFKAPNICNFNISYKMLKKNKLLELEHCLTFNNLEYQNRTEESQIGKRFNPFYPLMSKHQTLYLGFDTPLLKGPVNLFFSLEEQEYNSVKRPKIEWEYYRERNSVGEWVKLEVLDETKNLTQSGTIELVGASDFTKASFFNEKLYWIRGVDVRDQFKTREQSFKDFIVDNLKAIKNDEIEIHPYLFQDFYHLLGQCDELSFLSDWYNKTYIANPKFTALKPFHPRFSVPSPLFNTLFSPKINGIFLNTVMSKQVESMKNEIIGSSDGKKNQSFRFTRSSVISEEIYVNEFGTLSEGERKELIESNQLTIYEIKDEKDNTTEFWVKWMLVDDIKEANSIERCYEIDRAFGVIQFGDGVNGMIPPIGSNNIKTNYQVGGGIRGNVDPLQIINLQTSIAGIDSVSNPEAAMGGCDTESIEQALKRGPKMLKHQDRAVTIEDFENLAFQASRNIAKVKCHSNIDDKGQFQPGCITIMIIPQSHEIQPKPSAELKRQVEKYLRRRAANVIVPEKLLVTGPAYVEVSVCAELMATSIDQIPVVEKEVMKKLKEFLHPLSGGFEGRGWEFGNIPCLSDFYVLLEAIEGMDYVKDISMVISEINNGKCIEIHPNCFLEVRIPPYAMIMNGKHHLKIKGSINNS
ncbi:putative baseplate assembly protein [Bacillus toyonensis]|uniref:putative baseplate assembly protein n=1 Tax=Bacillus toyonensis TaxID=155322 RepID=UPI001C00BDB5|nr:putative baseplate assembly protein [Bacillus toyonensis]QWH88427.1 putative baseplate assembly protein [Bacillus toyonensis]QWI31602.1 putative baseplate assembly protein [Bacillus toyonensis]